MRPPTEGEHLGSHLGHRGAPARCRCRRPGPPAGGMTEWRRARSRSASFRTSSAAASPALTEAPISRVQRAGSGAAPPTLGALADSREDAPQRSPLTLDDRRWSPRLLRWADLSLIHIS